MKTIEVKGTERKDLGKKATADLRAAKQVPGIIYGGEKVIHFSADETEFRDLVYTPSVYIVNITVDGAKYQAIMKDLQFHPVSDKLLHLDFLQVSENKSVSIKLPVKLEGLSEGVKQGGKLVLKQRLIKVKVNVNNLPDELIVDVTNLGLGKTIKIGDLSFNNIELLEPKNNVVATVKLTRSAISAQQEQAK